MRDTSHLNDSLGRLRALFCRMVGTELSDADLATSAQLDDEECRILLAVLQETGAIEQRRRHVFLCRRHQEGLDERVERRPLRRLCGRGCGLASAAAIVLPADVAYKDAAREELKVRPGLSHARV